MVAKNPQIKPLATNQRVLTWICVCPVESTTSKNTKLLCIMFTITLYLIILIAFASSFVFFIENISIDMEKSFYALLQLIVFTGQAYVLMSIFISRHKITAFIKTLSDIYETSMNINNIIFVCIK